MIWGAAAKPGIGATVSTTLASFSKLRILKLIHGQVTRTYFAPQAPSQTRSQILTPHSQTETQSHFQTTENSPLQP